MLIDGETAIGMSREKVTEILSDMRAEYNLFGDEDEATRYHVLSMAIQAMEADPVTDMSDLISRQAVMKEFSDFVRRANNSDFAKTPTWNDAVSLVGSLPSAQQWIPVTEGLPEEDTDVLISYRYKEGDGDTSHVYIDITSYGDMYFGGRKVKGAKHWRPPFEYFTSNYEVIAWMPLPEPWKGKDGEER